MRSNQCNKDQCLWHKYIYSQKNCKRRYFVKTSSHWVHEHVSSYTSMHYLFVQQWRISLKCMRCLRSVIFLLDLATLPWWCHSGRWCALQGGASIRALLSGLLKQRFGAFFLKNDRMTPTKHNPCVFIVFFPLRFIYSGRIYTRSHLAAAPSSWPLSIFTGATD